MKTALIIHGHFYQPPRENPKTGIVPKQQSASPFDNWNEAVFKTCYEPNAFSRYLTSDGKVDSIYNNYCTISSNFGPTLLNWIDDTHPAFIEKLREADRASIGKFGHSCFIAQTYNHTILPLDSKKNKKIQIQWALEDYRVRFGHESEGFWCSECAIDKYTVDELAEAGIKFVILSPWQVESINGEKLNGNPAPCNRPFIINGNKHRIAAFFYNAEYASGISFGHFLTDADKLYQNLVNWRTVNKQPKLLTWATDGEIYGHHEPFGDMALAALIKKVNNGDDFYFTNFGAYLEKNPPKEIAELYLGEDGRGSSWSCCHGVKRWDCDCGCHTGGDESWNQEWRKPLRDALNTLESSIRKIYDDELKKILGYRTDTEKILINYKKVITKQVSEYEYVNRLCTRKSLSHKQIYKILTLLKAMKNVLFSFTSCGWFFNDISGIEPTQNISYAVYAILLVQKIRKNNFLETLCCELKKAKSNLDETTGESIAKLQMSKLKAAKRSALQSSDSKNTALGVIASSIYNQGNELQINSMTVVFNMMLDFFVGEFNNGTITDEKALQMLKILKTARIEHYNVDITALQNAVWEKREKLNRGIISDKMLTSVLQQLNLRTVNEDRRN